MPFDIDDPDVDYLVCAVQNGVVARRQLLELGASASDVERLLRRRDLHPARMGGSRVPGVYLVHGAPPTRQQREWTAVLSAWPAALAGESALPEESPRTVTIAVAPGRKAVAPRGVDVVRVTDFVHRTRWDTSPPRLEIEHALIDVMSKRITDQEIDTAFAILARTLHSRRTTPKAVLTVLGQRTRVGGRAVLRGLLTDARDGVCSVLERGYLHDVERAHGLPHGTRQRVSTATGAVTLQDVRYDEFGFIVELNGRGFHDRPDSWDSDAARDLAELATNDDRTARVTYGLVYGAKGAAACRTATWIGQVLQRLGWTGEVQACPRCRSWRRSAA